MIPNLNDFHRCYRHLIARPPIRSKYRFCIWAHTEDPTLAAQVEQCVMLAYEGRFTKSCDETTTLESGLHHIKLWFDYHIDEAHERSVFNRPVRRDENGLLLCTGCRTPVAIRLKKNGEPAKIQGSWCSNECRSMYYNPRWYVWERDKGICEKCLKQCIYDGNKADGFELNHRVEIIKGGGALGPENWQTLCKPCHKQETARLAAERAQERRDLAEKLNPRKSKQLKLWPKRKLQSRPFPKRG